MKIDNISQTLPSARYQRCPECDALFLLMPVKATQNAYCPSCDAKVHNGRDWSLTRLGAMAITMIMLMPLAFTAPLLSILMLGSRVDVSLWQGIWQMAVEGDAITAAMVLFCLIGAPAILALSIIYLWLGNILGMNLRPVLLMLTRLKEWVMLDIYLVGIGIACIKVSDYAFIDAAYGLIAFVALVILSLLTLIHLNVEQLWNRFYPRRRKYTDPEHLRICLGCHLTTLADERGRCPRCHTPLRFRRRHSLQKTWAALIASFIFLLPANLLPISILYVNGVRQEDTIFSGIISLANSNIAIAIIVFIASILVPFTKIIVMVTLLLSIHLDCGPGLKTRMKMLRFVTWIGRWSMLDLFVIALMMTLINRDLLLAFTMGPAAVYFGAAVILTLLAVEWLDSRLLWDVHASGNTRFCEGSPD
ncbi:membrane integrity lipid transport subunit YebS [Klebsiella sp. BIGb0407]|uniref:membrane integrity lipid transport subunit YebS n=1 Tax=Klebsiella sp. BIGb0407 TaxID=2940603 RepID=UPI00216A6CC8|nr:membrane integrity lipid transport subunit YebS [Klebsiella sp. BIGb0407]MCS3430395.1 paraquat-inducible protein A [Klebsiella sp. BIGb0407]